MDSSPDESRQIEGQDVLSVPEEESLEHVLAINYLWL